jgi:hypothetical protein
MSAVWSTVFIFLYRLLWRLMANKLVQAADAYAPTWYSSQPNKPCGFVDFIGWKSQGGYCLEAGRLAPIFPEGIPIYMHNVCKCSGSSWYLTTQTNKEKSHFANNQLSPFVPASLSIIKGQKLYLLSIPVMGMVTTTGNLTAIPMTALTRTFNIQSQSYICWY